MLTIFYDGKCPLCVTEMHHLKQHDKHNAIKLVDIHQADFTAHYPEIKFTDAMKILHGYYDKKLLLGLEVTHRAWTIVGKGYWVAPLNWPLIKTLSHGVYLLLARYRHQISRFFSKKFGLKAINCSSGTCYDNSTNADHRRQ